MTMLPKRKTRLAALDKIGQLATAPQAPGQQVNGQPVPTVPPVTPAITPKPVGAPEAGLPAAPKTNLVVPSTPVTQVTQAPGAVAPDPLDVLNQKVAARAKRLGKI